MIALSLIPNMNKTISTITTPSYSSGVVSLAPVILIVSFAAIIFVVLGLVAGEGTTSDGKGNKRSFKLTIEMQSRKLEQYINNLDELLGIKTVDNELTNGLILNERNELNIGTKYHWYIVDKHTELNMFKVVGLHENDAILNKIYILGNYDGKPYLKEINSEYIKEENIQRCLNAAGIK